MRIFSERVVGVGEAGVAARVPAAPRARAVFGPVLFQQVGQSLLTQVGVLLTSGAPCLPIDERPAVARGSSEWLMVAIQVRVRGRYVGELAEERFV